ncbi:hypothetical protein EDD86DRAFT_47105 [Gorgonomyces haynaldii]|nr:hypothetical protein EDD86DRAFT_47105 [Gorgonomyces haynaldii]
MRPSKEFVGDEISNCLDAFRSDTFEYKTVIQDLKNQVHDLENARKEKQDELQDVLNKIKEADEMLSQKYSEYLAMGQDKERKEKEDAKSKMWRKGMKKFNLGMKKENAKDPIKTSFESLRDRASSAESLRADNGKPTDLAKKMEEAPYHRFIPHSYRSPKKCDMCQENMWGKEFKCDVCGFHCHVKCSANVTGTCKRLIQEKTVDKQGIDVDNRSQ